MTRYRGLTLLTTALLASCRSPEPGTRSPADPRSTTASAPAPDEGMLEAYAEAQAQVRDMADTPTSTCALYDEDRPCWRSGSSLLFVPPFPAAFPFNAFRLPGGTGPIEPRPWKDEYPVCMSDVANDPYARRAAPARASELGLLAAVVPPSPGGGRARLPLTAEQAIERAKAHWDPSFSNSLVGHYLDFLLVPVHEAADGAETLRAWELWASRELPAGCRGDCPMVLRRDHALLYCRALGTQDGIGAPERCTPVVRYTSTGPWIRVSKSGFQGSCGAGGDETWVCEPSEPDASLLATKLQAAIKSSPLGIEMRVLARHAHWQDLGGVKRQEPSKVLRSLPGAFRETITLRATIDADSGAINLVPTVYVANGNPRHDEYKLPTEEQWKYYQSAFRALFRALGCEARVEVLL
jgi:hypothetical protein